MRAPEALRGVEGVARGSPRRARREGASRLTLLYILSAISIACGVWLMEVWRPAGLDADYGIRLPNGTRVSLSTGRARQLTFRKYEQLLTPYLESWQVSRAGASDRPPFMDIVWTGILAVRRPTTVRLRIDAVGDWTARIDDETWRPSGAGTEWARTLPAGDHPVRIHYANASTNARFVLSSLGAPLYPSGAHRDTVLRMRGWLVAALALCIAGLWLVSRHVPPRHLGHAALAGLVVLGAYLRLQDRWAVPHHNATADEYYEIWAGRTLVGTGTPTSWSDLPAYGSAGSIESWFGSPYRIVGPTLDQPPLFTALVGTFGKLSAAFSSSPHFGGPWFWDGPPFGHMRILPILLSCAAILLVHAIGRRLHGWSAGFGAALIYATTPILVALHRLIKGESLLTVLALGVVATVLARRAGAARWQPIVLGCLCAAAPLAKLTGVFVAPMAICLLWSRRGRDRAGLMAVTAGSLGGAAVLAAWGAVQGWSLFWQVTLNQAGKPSSILSAARLLYDPHLITGPFGPGWIWWLALGALPALWAGPSRVLLPGLAAYLLVIASSADQRSLFGWYAIPIYALLVVPAATILIRRRYPGTLILFWIVYGGQSVFMAAPLGLSWGWGAIVAGSLLAAAGEIVSRRSSSDWGNRIAWTLVLIVVAVNIMLILNQRLAWTGEQHDHSNRAVLSSGFEDEQPADHRGSVSCSHVINNITLFGVPIKLHIE